MPAQYQCSVCGDWKNADEFGVRATVDEAEKVRFDVATRGQRMQRAAAKFRAAAEAVHPGKLEEELSLLDDDDPDAAELKELGMWFQEKALAVSKRIESNLAKLALPEKTG